MKLAAIDIGTNSIHMVVVETDARASFTVVDREKSMVKLGAGLFGTRRLTERAFNDGLEAMRRYARLAENHGVDEILAVATSATREAENGGDFLDAIFRDTGVKPRVISGIEEARLIYLAVRHTVDLGLERALIVDIGGGSVEVIVGDCREVLMSESLRLGVQRLLERRGSTKPLPPKVIHELQGYIRGVASDALGEARRFDFVRVIGTSGTIRTLGEAAHLMNGGTPWRSVNAQVARRKDIKDLTKKLLELGESERAKLPGIGEQRADTIHLGAVLLSEILELANKDELTLCDGSLREGVIIDHLERHGAGGRAHRPVPDVRRRSVFELMAKYGRDDPREEHIAGLALQLFEQTRSLHGYGATERELLEYAALLHGIGQHISFRRRQQHSEYIIRYSDLRGFSDEELELIGLLVLYHRKAPPRSQDARLRRLSLEERRKLRILSGILRIAVSLDRGRSQVVKRLRADTIDGKLELRVAGVGDLELEIWAASSKTSPLARALDREIVIGADSGVSRLSRPPSP
ncbi:MAG TPA: Ppx/GppA phosphatase family protein [Polyangiaceae bacterium]|nr:Ppx/GppA phosphatase family protein [Polyangiaceae bacterium]